MIFISESPALAITCELLLGTFTTSDRCQVTSGSLTPEDLEMFLSTAFPQEEMDRYSLSLCVSLCLWLRPSVAARNGVGISCGTGTTFCVHLNSPLPSPSVPALTTIYSELQKGLLRFGDIQPGGIRERNSPKPGVTYPFSQSP